MPTTTSEIVNVILSDLSSLGTVARPGVALTGRLQDSPSSRMAFSRPNILEQPNPARSGSSDGSAHIVLTLVFQVTGQLGLQGASDPLSLAHYDLGYRLRSMFHAPTAHVRTLASSVVVQQVDVLVAQENDGRTWAGSFALRVAFDEMPPETQST